MLTVSTLKEAGISLVILCSGGALYIAILAAVLFYQLCLYAVWLVKKREH